MSSDTLLTISQQSASLLKNELQLAHQTILELQNRIIALEHENKTLALNQQRLLGEKESLALHMECVKGERDEYKYQLKKAEKENKRLEMLLDAAERDFSDSD